MQAPSPTITSDSWASAGTSWRGRVRHVWQHHRRLVLIGATLLVAIPLVWGLVDLERLHAWAEHVNPLVLFAALVLLPLGTFPVTPLNVVAGIRFGLVGGLAFVAGAIVCQHLLAFFTARILPFRLRDKLEPLRQRLPAHAHADATIFTSLLPGAPYWAQLYVLPIIGVPLWTYVILSSALHAVRSLIAVIAGEISDHPSTGWAIALVVYGALLATACYFAGRRMTRKYGDRTAAPR